MELNIKINANEAVKVLNEVLEDLEWIYGLDNANDLIWDILAKHDVIKGCKYELSEEKENGG